MMPNLDIVSVEIALKLREAGWSHEWAVGDWYIGHDDGLPHLVKTDKDAMLLSIFGAERVHLPSRRDLEKALEEMGYYLYYSLDSQGCDLFCSPKGKGDPAFEGWRQTADTPADAVALAYLEAKERQDADS